MPQSGERRPDGKVWAGDDFGWQSPATIWKKQPPGKVGDTRTLPGLGTKVYTGTDYGWQLQSTIDKKKTQQPTPDPKPAPAPATPYPKPAPATPDPKPAPATPEPKTPEPKTPAPRPVPPKSARQLELDKINADKTLTPDQKWAKANPGLAAVRREREAIRGTSETDNPLMQGLRSRLPAAKTALDTTALKADLAKSGINPSAYSRLLNNPRRMKYQQPSVEKEAYDVVLDYLLSEGHADTVEEAHYVMMQLDSEYIQSIVEAGEGRVNLTYPAGHPKYGQPMKVDGKPMSVSKKTADWNSKMNRYKEQDPEGYKKAKGMMGPYGWTEPPKGYNPPNWM
jgi:outer membrane biosynthesis protein TonB